ncbi:hypothetical protein HYC85_021846 [Camellia sinensis]|uniref:RNA polymerase Rpb5 N-terminal domain-containing protein n=1 Tax=Camellia sinensis TaxID=4442 RepID=A0A7J7GIQ2_CAMSI|nr:hypothetical protein HYC85_021846 [Camellia sinensis]
MDGDAVDMDLNGEAYGRCLSSFVDEGSKESHRYYLARRTLLEMLRDRGYAVSSSDIELSLQDFRSIHGQNPDADRLRIFASLRSGPANKIMNRETVTRLILVVQNQMTNQAQKAVDLFSFKVEIFQIPWMLQKDAIARYYGWEKGQVVKVSYSDEITESHVTYCCVWWCVFHFRIFCLTICHLC